MRSSVLSRYVMRGNRRLLTSVTAVIAPIRPKSLSMRPPYKTRGMGTKKRQGFSVDRSGLIGGEHSEVYKIDEGGEDQNDVEMFPNSEHKEPLTELAKDLAAVIGVKGPISLHEYLGQCSNHIMYGYYQTDKEKIGRGGDFTTAPEVSQLFGEMVGTWCVSHWMALGEPKKINIIELGPGKGTLMKDILTVAGKFPKFEKAISAHMVELSEAMRDVQRETLECSLTSLPPPVEPSPLSSNPNAFDAQEVLERHRKVEEAVMRERRSGLTPRGTPVNWYYTFNQLPENSDTPCLVVAQEFLDVFPVHQFVYKDGLWLEKLVDVDKTAGNPLHFRMVLSQAPTPASITLMGKGEGHQFSEGDGVEVSPVALATCEEIAARVCKAGGAALLVDYGANATSSDSLRGFKDHETANILSLPGLVDTTADVDFDACGRVAARRGAKVVGAITQAEFLIKMGVVERAEQLISLDSTTEEEQASLVSSLSFLVDEHKMGERFKVMTILDPKTAPATSTIGFPSSL